MATAIAERGGGPARLWTSPAAATCTSMRTAAAGPLQTCRAQSRAVPTPSALGVAIARAGGGSGARLALGAGGDDLDMPRGQRPRSTTGTLERSSMALDPARMDH